VVVPSEELWGKDPVRRTHLPMAERLDPRQAVTFEELLTNEEVLEEIKAVRREMEGKR